MENQISPSLPEGGSTRETINKKKLQRGVVMISIFALVIDATTVRSLSLLAPFIRSELGIDKSQFGYIVSALMAGTMLTTLPTGALIGRLNISKAFTTIMTAMGLALFVVSGQDSLFGIMAALFLVGLLRTGITPLVNRVITEQFDRNQRGAIMGFIYAAVPLGGFLGAIVLPALGEFIEWSVGYRLLGSVALLGALITWKFTPKDMSLPHNNQPAFGLIFFRSRVFLILSLSYGLYALSMASEAFITLYLVDVVKISALIAGMFYGIIQVTGVGGRVVWGILSDRYFSNNRWWLLAATNWLSVISLILLTLLTPQSPWWTIAAIMILIGISAASSWGMLCTLLGDVVGIGSIAIATATIFFITNIADVIGPVLFGGTLQRTNSYQTAFSTFMCFAAFSALIFTWMAHQGRSQKNTESQ